MRKISGIILFIIMTAQLLPQSSFEFSGESFTTAPTPAAVFEVNPFNYLSIKDWGLSITFGGEIAAKVSSNLYSAALAKKIGSQGFTVRFTPGYQKDFIFRNGQSIIFGDSIEQNLESRFSYKELFGLGYSFDFSELLTGGFSFRYFSQEFSTESLNTVISDTIYILRETTSEKLNTWRGDVGFIFHPFDELAVSISSINLFAFGENAADENLRTYELKKIQAARFGFYFNLSETFSSHFLYETTGGLSTGFNNSFTLFDGRLTAGLNIFHDKYQQPFISSMQPYLSFSLGLFGVTLSGISYISNRTSNASFAKFRDAGIHNIIHNGFSYDKVTLTVGFILNTFKEKEVELIDIEILRDIYPILAGDYIDEPFAKGTVVNLTNEIVIIKPESKIEGLNFQSVQSESVTLMPNDTAEVKFYTIVPENYSSNKSEIFAANFYLFAGDDEPDDYFQKPLLVQGINAWDGRVSHLKYFIKKDISLMGETAKSILRQEKSLLDTTSGMLSNFYKSRIIFNEIVKDLVYVSDPRATADYVQFPAQTLNVKGGDCDDLSVLYSALLQSVGIETALVDYRANEEERHVNVLVNTGMSPDLAQIITGNDKKYIVRADEKGNLETWIIIETTSLTDFNTAWETGAAKFQKEAVSNYGLVKGSVDIVDID